MGCLEVHKRRSSFEGTRAVCDSANVCTWATIVPKMTQGLAVALQKEIMLEPRSRVLTDITGLDKATQKSPIYQDGTSQMFSLL